MLVDSPRVSSCESLWAVESAELLCLPDVWPPLCVEALPVVVELCWPVPLWVAASSYAGLSRTHPSSPTPVSYTH
ncbi:MAG: hypothetical protein KUG77_18075, partial [Nannocystaceae bacterium]|nr:hypothetical protein [Nannocystaceae bacterium]